MWKKRTAIENDAEENTSYSKLPKELPKIYDYLWFRHQRKKVKENKELNFKQRPLRR